MRLISSMDTDWDTDRCPIHSRKGGHDLRLACA